MELITTNFLNSKNIPLKMVVSYERDKLKINGDKTENQLYVTFYLRREGDNKNGFMLSRYYLNTLLEGDFAKGLWENPTILEQYTSTHPMKRIGEPDEVAGAAIMLASDAGKYINGQTIIVDGGATA